MATFEVNVNGEVYEVDGVSTPEEAYQHVQTMLGPQPGEEGFEHDFDALEMVSNLPGSAWGMLKGTYEALRHPIQTGTAMANLIEGGFKTAAGAELEEDERQAVEGFSQMMVERYGGWEEFQKTLEEDPAGVMADLSMFVTGGGSAMARAPGVVGRVGQTVKGIGAGMEPVTAATTATAKGAKGVGSLLRPEKRYERTIRFPANMKPKDRSMAIREGLQNWLMPSRAGTAKRTGLAVDIGNQLDELILEHADAAGNIPAGAIHRVFGEVRDQIGLDPGALDDLRIIDDMEDAWRTRMESLGKDSMTLEEIQDFKTKTYKKINWKRKDPATDPMTEEVSKALAREAREQVATKVPGVQELNDQLAGLKALQDPLTAAANRSEYASMFGLGSLTKAGLMGGGGMAVGLSPEIAAALTAAGVAMGHPKIQAAVALIANKMKTNDVNWIKENAKIPAVAMVMEQLGRTTEFAREE